MRSILGLGTQPVAVNFYRAQEALTQERTPEKLRYCQALMKAREGERVILTLDNLSCPAAFGFRPLPEKIAS
jgi:uncharacterized protein (DUF169 family)